MPDATLGSGYARMIDTITELQLGGEVTVALFFHLRGSEEPGSGRAASEYCRGRSIATRRRRRPRAAEVRPSSSSRCPTTIELVSPILAHFCPGAPVIYDAEALDFRRLERQAKLAEGEVRRAACASGGDATPEERIAAEADAVVCIAEEEA